MSADPQAAAASSPPIEIRDLTVRYGRSVVLADLGLAVEPGTVYTLLGRNGVGKSSLVRCLLGTQRPAAGSVRLFGDDVWRRRARLLADVGVVPETPDAPPGMTAAELAAFVAPLYPRFDRTLFDAQLERFTIPSSVPFGKLSRGQKTQVGLALALAPRPRLLVLDDPTLGLDPVARRAVVDQLVDELADFGTTVFLTTHDLAGAERLATHVGVLAGGRLVVDEELDALRGRMRRLTWPSSAGRDGDGRAAGQLQPPAPLPTALAARLDLRATQTTAWGTAAIVGRYDAALLPALAGSDGTLPRVEPLDLETIFAALAGSRASDPIAIQSATSSIADPEVAA